MTARTDVAKVEKIRELAAAGDLSKREIAGIVGCSEKTVRRILLAQPVEVRSPPPPVEPPPEAEPDEPEDPIEQAGAPSLADLAADVAAQIREARRDAKVARAQQDDAKLARSTKTATTLTLLLARVTKDSPASSDHVLVEKSKMQAAADRAFEKLVGYVASEEARAGS